MDLKEDFLPYARNNDGKSIPAFKHGSLAVGEERVLNVEDITKRPVWEGGVDPRNNPMEKPDMQKINSAPKHNGSVAYFVALPEESSSNCQIYKKGKPNTKTLAIVIGGIVVLVVIAAFNSLVDKIKGNHAIVNEVDDYMEEIIKDNYSDIEVKAEHGSDGLKNYDRYIKSGKYYKDFEKILAKITLSDSDVIFMSQTGQNPQDFCRDCNSLVKDILGHSENNVFNAEVINNYTDASITYNEAVIDRLDKALRDNSDMDSTDTLVFREGKGLYGQTNVAFGYIDSKSGDFVPFVLTNEEAISIGDAIAANVKIDEAPQR